MYLFSGCVEILFGWTWCLRIISAAHRSQSDVLAGVVYFDGGGDDFDVSGAEQSSWTFSTL